MLLYGYRRLMLAGLLLLAPLPAAAQNRGTVAGTVTSNANEPVGDAEIRILALGFVSRTDADGRFTFENVPAGSYVLDAESARYGRVTERVQVEAGRTTQVALRLDPVFHVEPILVTAGPEAVRRTELYQAADALAGRELRSRVEPTLGETLRNQPGVNATYFGPGSSRPIIRGLGGDRVRVLESGVGVGDASNTSPDHAVSIEPQLAERIEVVRGPATLLYGSSAIGGVVNVLDGRIPDERPGRPVSGSLHGLLGSAADERNGSLEVTGAAGPFVLHVGGLLRKTGDVEIPGFAEHAHEGEAPDADAVEGVLPNSALETQRGSAGLSWIGRSGYVGAAFSGYFTEYGVPGGGHAHEEEGPGEEEEAPVVIDMDQRRVDAEALWRFGGFVRGLKARFGLTDYEHRELEGDEIGTTFRNDFAELRVEAQHRLGDDIHGAFGTQYVSRDFEAIGDEAFVPPNETRVFALFLFEELDRGPVRYQLGARWERQNVGNATNAFDRTFNGVSASAGVNVALSDAFTVAVHGARSVKLPTAEELFSDGPHLATRSFEVGNPDLDREVGWSGDLSLRLTEGRVTGELTGFVNRFEDFIFPAFTGAEQDELPVLEYTQGDALFVGLEGRAEVELFHNESAHLGWEVMGDLVRAELIDGDTPLPRIPPLRIGTGLRIEGTQWGGRINLMRVTDQDRVSDFEEPTEGYTMLDASVNYRLFTGGLVHELILTGTNLTDAEARSHVSLLKEFAPLPGRGVRLAYRIAF